ncbi:MAG TPA: hypothetical protein VL307_13465 [Chitinophagaceae bacterium]|nr:hypothetical protein [Chitinophagaceae bacterium]
MNINRNNYEEFFMLYADGELSATDKELVEAFVAANPDMAQELDLFRQFKLTPDASIVYEDKAALLKGEGSAALVNAQNCESFFVLYADNELSIEQKRAVEDFVYHNPQWQSSFELLQEVKMEADASLVFANKEILFRHEKNERVVPFKWWRLAAAAILLLSAGMFWLYRPRTTEILPAITKNTPGVTNIPGTPLNRSVEQDTSTKMKQTVPQTILPEEALVNNEQPLHTPAYTVSSRHEKAQRQKLPAEEVNEAPGMVKATNVTSAEEGRLTGSKPSSLQNDATKPALINTAIAAAASKTVIDHALTYRESATVEAPETGSEVAATSADQVEVLTTSVNTKNSLRGFFRKASRLVARKTNSTTDDDSKRKSILIGGFEIAVR